MSRYWPFHVDLEEKTKEKCILLQCACLDPDKHHKDYPIVLVLNPSSSLKETILFVAILRHVSQFLVRKMSFFRL